MSTSASVNTERMRPAITLSAADFEQLSALTRAAMNGPSDVAATLADELDRAQVLPAGSRPDDCVSMGSEVRFQDETTLRTQTVTLVYPNEADIAASKVSVLTPIGAALIGLRAGDSINWETRNGEIRRLTVLSVKAPA